MINDPFDRTKFLDLLRPPIGFSFDEAIGTTFSLDLPALLVAPLAFTLFDAEGDDGQIMMESFELLASLRRFGRKITVFCHAGRILSPAVRLTQFVHLEKMIVECLPRSGGSFHPKVWVLRFIGADDAVIYRMVCMTRNLTFDQSWDTALTLEGPLANRNFARNRPLADFVSALPQFAMTQVDPSVSARVAKFAAELRRVDFELPNGIEEVRFWPLGIDGYRRLPFSDDIRRMLVISPFLSKTLLSELVEERPGSILVSTLPAIAEIGERPQTIEKMYTISDAAVAEPQGEDDDTSLERVATGLHAKCYVADNGRLSSIYTGSANATSAAFHQNVEFLVELQAPRKQFGIDALLSPSPEKGTTRLFDLLVEVSGSTSLPEVDQEAVEIGERLDDARSAIVRASGSLHCEPAEDGSRYDVAVVVAKQIAVPDAVGVKCWPVTLGSDRAVSMSLSESPAAVFRNLTLLALTRFLNVELTAGEGQRRTFVVMLPLEGGPSDREEQLLSSILSDKSKVVQWLLLLIADDVGRAGDEPITHDPAQRTFAGGSASFASVALLETFLRVLDRAPERLDDVHRLITDLRSTEEGRQRLPPDFDSVWLPLWEARERRRRC
jgi:hypothetical protein